MRTRYVTRPPHMEFAARPGAARPLDHRVAALLLSKFKTIEPKMHGITLRINGHKLVYWRPDSIIFPNVGSPKLEKIRVYYDPEDMRRVHCLTLSGKYIETVPLKEHITPLQHTEDNKRILAGTRAANRLAMQALKAARQPDIADAVDTAIQNRAAIDRAVTQLPAPAPKPEAEPILDPMLLEADAPAPRAGTPVLDAITRDGKRFDFEDQQLDRASIAEAHLARMPAPLPPSRLTDPRASKPAPACIDPFDLDD